MLLSSIILAVSFAVLVYFIKSFLKGLGEEMVTSRERSQEDMMKLQKEFNTQVSGLAQSFTKHSLELHALHLTHLKELELKMMSGGAKDYVDAQTMYEGQPNFQGSGLINEDWVDFAPHPVMTSKQLKNLNFGVEDADGKVRVLGGKKE